ncbi:GDCCVxC domain-containing (seleno)protein [Citromicrobium bathyomarinum]|uniref:GDCCVxC domain-containing (seleno)protein n=1 Tax=Novosphingobium marinum TaxID=1514948 RepID=UPI0024681BF5|nr:GDCCVxC domain-containing (seleno)protein [Novosphingobium marinum]
MIELKSEITCPTCGHKRIETMPTDACWFFYDCHGCGVKLRPNAGDCCVFCSFGTIPCPPIQETRADGTGATCCGGR